MKRLLCALILAGCRPPASAAPDPFTSQAYASGEASPRTKVFLVAGGDDVANFAAEVLEQRTLWRRAGLREDELACYWARPTKEGLAEDGPQYQELALALRSCRAATPEQLFSDLRAAATEANDFVYVFVSSHGLPSQLRSLQRSTHRRTQRFVASLAPEERDVLAPAAIGLEAGEGPGLGEPRAIVAALRDGRPPEAVVFSPATLAPVLASFPEHVRKVVVLQACFSGAFIDHHAEPHASSSASADALLAIPHLTVMTATAAERPSFGCGSGEARTYFGAAVNVALRHALDEHPPADLPWSEIYDDVTLAIEAMESVSGQRASVPGFVDTALSPGPRAPATPDERGVPDEPLDDAPGGS